MSDEEKGESKVAGGIARARVLAPEKRKEIAARAAAARWTNEKVDNATHKGNFATEFGVEVECYVLNDSQRTALISQRGMGQAIGFSRRGSRFSVFVNSATTAEYIGRDLREKIEKPSTFQAVPAAAGSPVTDRSHGYDATILIDIRRSIVAAKADGKLTSRRYANMIRQAEIIVGASAKSGIRNLVYALAGYNPTAAEVIAAFRLYIQEEARKHEQEFPNDLYMEWHRLYSIPIPVRGKPWQFKHMTVKYIYYSLARSRGKLLELLRALRSQGGDRQKKHFQFLNDTGARALRMHIGRVLEWQSHRLINSHTRRGSPSGSETSRSWT